MKHDFRREYEEYMNKKTPDLWNRIEKGITEETQETQENRENQETQENQENRTAVGKPGRIRIFRILATAAAIVCVVGISTWTLLPDRQRGQSMEIMQSQKKNQTASDAAEEPQEKTAETAAEEPQEMTADTAAAEPQEMTADTAAAEPQKMTADTAAAEPQEIAANMAAAESQEMVSSMHDAKTQVTEKDMTAESEEMVMNYAAEASGYVVPDNLSPVFHVPESRESYAQTGISGFSLTALEPLSTFSADVDTASYANVRRMIEDGYSIGQIDPYAVRPEEFINYFSYDLKDPEDGEKFGVTTKIGICPWNEKHRLLFVGMKTEDLDLSEAPAENLTFLLDVSGSMDEPDKLPLLQKSFQQLLDQLDEDDTVSIVTYANGVEVVLDSAKGTEKSVIADAINSLKAEGGTYGEGGIQKAYDLAEKNFRPEANNRIILATDGDLNIGISEPDELERFIREKRDKGIGLSVLGFGTGNLRDDNMERLADCGNGNYSYIDSILEARKVMVEEMGASFHTVAEDVRLQVEFNPAFVNAYRLIGYENRLMDAADFRNDQKDAGEIGAGHNVVVLYELIPAESGEAVELKYQKKEQTEPDADDEYGTVTIRYKEPGETEGQEAVFTVDHEDEAGQSDEDLRFAAAAAELAMILRDDPNKGTASLEGILEMGHSFKTDDEYKQEFFYLVRFLLKNS